VLQPLEGKVAVITGSSRGIGKVTALELARDGADVVISARVEQPIEGRPGWSLEEAAAAVRDLGRRVLAVRMDVTRDADVRSMIDTTLREFGRVDILVNNAARMGGGEPFIGGSPGLFDEFIETNLRAPYMLAQLVAPHMAETGGGTIINITSAAARMPGPPREGAAYNPQGSGVGIGYGIAKAGLNRWMAGVAPELKSSNIAIVNIDPGLTITERNQLNPRPGVDYSRADSPEVTAKAIAFICRDPMPYTGSIVVARELVDKEGLLV
jgi:NAD(P)-dependent dehydrogenase (short-subunit alcohol dehydrogenase family)